MDRSATDYAYSLAGGHAMEADKLRRQAHDLRQEAARLDAQADHHMERAAWAEELAAALNQEEKSHG